MARRSMMEIAKAAPSTGSVPEPNSSISTRLSESASSMMETMLVMCAEKVDRLCSILCSSPMSTNTFLYTEMLLFSATGSIRPHIAIRVSRPIVFKVTVLPPVFGPVMTRVLKSLPRLTSIGTTFSGSING